ncbi:hypothetical protein [Emticicia fluvialis]|uniref:hypothetical protein n=1 Tax=Emticicia fluvialis TaxID=2974474 RepID=UPI0021667F07|nr:hypothetical protein [Emticicia fluvialis]
MKTLLKDWNAVRIIRLVAGMGIIIMAFIENQLLLSVIGLLLVVQAVMNFGCGPGGCSIPDNRRYRRRT